MRLHCWNRASRDIEFDPDTGTAETIELPRPRKGGGNPVGFAHFERSLHGARTAFAVFRSGDGIYFSAGARRWRLGQPGLRLSHTRPLPFLSRFEVIEDDRVSYSILYPHLGRVLMALVDPTYDRIDEESDFFLSFLARHGTSSTWREGVLEQWSPGPEG